MRRLVYHYSLILGSVLLLSLFRENLSISSIAWLFLFALIALGIEMTLKPLALILSLPLSLISLGVFVIVINGWLLMLADVMTPHFQLGGFMNALIVSGIITVVKWIYPFDRPSEELLRH